MVRSRLRVLLPLGIASALSLLGDSTLHTALPSHTAAAGITVSAIGIVLSANRLVRIFINSPLGSAYDRFGRRRPFVMPMILAVFSTFCYAVVEGFWSLLASRIVWGVAWASILSGMVIAAFMSAVGDLAPSGWGGLVMGGFATANDLGGTARPLVGYALGTGWRLEWAYLLCTLIFLSAGGAVWAIRARKKR
jgi:MFS family permease